MRKQAALASLFFIPAIFLPQGTVQAFDVVLRGDTPAHVYFSPDGGCTAAVLREVSRARSEILIQVYSFRSPSIVQALIAAHQRGVKVAMIMDKSERQEGLTPPTLMANAGIPVHLDGIHAVANSRIMLIDGQVVITGSFNFNTASEEMNAENLLIVESKELAAVYRDSWLEHRKHSEPFGR